MPAPDTYVIYGHGSFDSTSISSPCRVPTGARVHFATGHIREIGDDKMLAAANCVLLGCYNLAQGNTQTHWTADPNITSQFYEDFDAGATIPDYVLGDTAGLYTPALQEYGSASAAVIIRPHGTTTRLSAILSSPHWKNRHPLVHFIWCGCRAMNTKVTPVVQHDIAKYHERRNGIVLDL